MATTARIVEKSTMVHHAAHTLKKEGTLLVLHPSEPATSVVFFFHGLGDSGEGWLDAAEGVLAPALARTKFVLPTAQVQPVTVNGGMPMPSWYDITSLAGDRATQPCTGINDSKAFVLRLVDAEVARGIPADRIVLAGFSQGAALSLYVGLTCGRKLGGIVSMSGYLPRSEALRGADLGAASRTPIRMHHGTDDNVVRLKWAQDSLVAIKALDPAVDAALVTYAGLPHSANAAELSAVAAFLKSVLD